MTDYITKSRAELALGHLSDDALALQAFLGYDAQPNYADLAAGRAVEPHTLMVAVKDRIRWLSRQLESALAAQEAPTARTGPDYKAAYLEWSDKTDWVMDQQDSFPFRTLGIHRADVMREEIERLRKRVAELENLNLEPK